MERKRGNGEGSVPKIVAEKLGHSQISTTIDLYSQVTPRMQREAAETLDAMLKG
jgi:integrase